MTSLWFSNKIWSGSDVSTPSYENIWKFSFLRSILNSLFYEWRIKLPNSHASRKFLWLFSLKKEKFWKYFELLSLEKGYFNQILDWGLHYCSCSNNYYSFINLRLNLNDKQLCSVQKMHNCVITNNKSASWVLGLRNGEILFMFRSNYFIKSKISEHLYFVYHLLFFDLFYLSLAKFSGCNLSLDAKENFRWELFHKCCHKLCCYHLFNHFH